MKVELSKDMTVSMTGKELRTMVRALTLKVHAGSTESLECARLAESLLTYRKNSIGQLNQRNATLLCMAEDEIKGWERAAPALGFLDGPCPDEACGGAVTDGVCSHCGDNFEGGEKREWCSTCGFETTREKCRCDDKSWNGENPGVC